jgi:hypothetical protein
MGIIDKLVDAIKKDLYELREKSKYHWGRVEIIKEILEGCAIGFIIGCIISLCQK